MSHVRECGNVTDLHARVGWGLQHEQLGVACHQSFLNRPAFHFPISAFLCLTLCFEFFLYVSVLQRCVIAAWHFAAGICFHLTRA